MIIPPNTIESETLERIVEEFITRDGTDYGEFELSLAQKVEALLEQILAGEVVIVFDEASESVNLMNRRDAELSAKVLEGSDSFSSEDGAWNDWRDAPYLV